MSPNLRRCLVIFVLVPLFTGIAAYFVTVVSYSKYTRGIYEFLAFLLVADLAVALRRGWRNAATAIAAAIFGFAAIELACAALQADQPRYARGSRPVLGWGPSASGVYHSRRMGSRGRLIYDVDYTIDDRLLRRTLSGSGGPSVAFFGDSFMFVRDCPIPRPCRRPMPI
jgi:hypothetical protein